MGEHWSAIAAPSKSEVPDEVIEQNQPWRYRQGRLNSGGSLRYSSACESGVWGPFSPGSMKAALPVAGPFNLPLARSLRPIPLPDERT